MKIIILISRLSLNFVCFVALCLISFSCASESKDSSYNWATDDEKRLVDFLFTNYSNVVRPVEKKNLAVPVKMGIALAQLIDLVSFFLDSCQNLIYFLS